MCVLAGEPRAIDTVVIVVLAYFGWLLVRRRGRRIGFALGSAAGVALAVLLSAVQWIPGVITVSTSQRAVGAYALYSAGSLNPHWLSLLFVPGLLGGSGAFGTSPWYATYSLSEVMGYAGILALAAACGLLGTLRRRRPLPDWLLWEGVAVLGIALALGGNTPLGHLLVHVPLFGDQRLQSRNIAITDVALAVLLAYWGDEVLVRRATGRPARRRSLDRLQVCSLLPVAAAAGLAVAALATPAGIAHLVGATVDQATHSTADRPLFAVTLVVCAATAGYIVSVGRLSFRGRRLAVLSIATVDLVTFNVAALWPVAASSSLPPPVSPAAAATLGSALGRLASGIGTSGRYTIYNPLHLQGVRDVPLQVPDTNLYESRSSVQGYSSIVDAAYAAATGGHAANGAGLMTLSPSAVADGTLAQLDTTTLVTLPAYLLTPTSGSSATASGSRPLSWGTPSRSVLRRDPPSQRRHPGRHVTPRTGGLGRPAGRAGVHGRLAPMAQLADRGPERIAHALTPPPGPGHRRGRGGQRTRRHGHRTGRARRWRRLWGRRAPGRGAVLGVVVRGRPRGLRVLHRPAAGAAAPPGPAAGEVHPGGDRPGRRRPGPPTDVGLGDEPPWGGGGPGGQRHPRLAGDLARLLRGQPRPPRARPRRRPGGRRPGRSRRAVLLLRRARGGARRHLHAGGVGAARGRPARGTGGRHAAAPGPGPDRRPGGCRDVIGEGRGAGRDLNEPGLRSSARPGPATTRGPAAPRRRDCCRAQGCAGCRRGAPPARGRRTRPRPVARSPR